MQIDYSIGFGWLWCLPFEFLLHRYSYWCWCCLSSMLHFYLALLISQITFNDLITGLPWEQWHIPILHEKWVWTIIFAVFIYPLVLLRSMSSISFASQAGNYVLIAVLIIVLTYGAIYNPFKIDVSMLWPRKYYEIADMFGVICFSMGVAFIGLSSRVCLFEFY